MELYLHDNTPAKEGEKHGPKGPTHCGTCRDIDYEYQAEEHVKEIEIDHPQVVRIESSNGIVWARNAEGKFIRG